MKFEYCVNSNTYILELKDEVVKLKKEEVKELQELINKEIARTPTLEFALSKES